MKIAVITDDSTTISRHFGRACCYLVFTLNEGEIIEREKREKPGHDQFAHENHTPDDEHGHGFGKHSADKHTQMIEPIRDCETVIVRGMGRGAFRAMEQAHIHPIVTEIEGIDEAIQAYIDGSLVNHPEKLH